MTPAPLDPVLSTPINSLPLSEEFKRMATLNGCGTLQELLREPVAGLPYKSGSGFRALKELIAFLSTRGLGSIVED